MTLPAPIILWTHHDHLGHQWRAVMVSCHTDVAIVLQCDGLAQDVAQYSDEAAARAMAQQWLATFGGRHRRSPDHEVRRRPPR